MVPDCLKPCRCCKDSRTQQGVKKAIEKMNKETNIIDIIKSRRFFEAAIRKLLSREQIDVLKERSRYITIDPSAASGDEIISSDEGPGSEKIVKKKPSVSSLFESDLGESDGVVNEDNVDGDSDAG